MCLESEICEAGLDTDGKDGLNYTVERAAEMISYGAGLELKWSGISYPFHQTLTAPFCV